MMRIFGECALILAQARVHLSPHISDVKDVEMGLGGPTTDSVVILYMDCTGSTPQGGECPDRWLSLPDGFRTILYTMAAL